jgi:hypothetical protein
LDEYLTRLPEYAEVVRQAFADFPWQELQARLVPTAGRISPVCSAGEKATKLEEASPDERYMREKLLGEGGCASVYLGHDQVLHRTVAIKVPHANRVDVDHYLQEARTLAQLTHPSIVQVYDVGRDSQGCPYVVMQYVPGRTLAQQLSTARLGYAESARLMSTVAQAVHFAHKQGLVHRDLKPSNILLDETGRPYVADFGLALHSDVQDQHRGDASGTLCYRAPEQVRGKTHWVDGRCDVWALGVTFYEMLTGQRPFRSEQDAPFFFGRDEMVRRVWDVFRGFYLRDRSAGAEAAIRFLCLIGPSGCGKSSLARAGLIATLANKALPGWQSCRVAVLTPGRHPVESLAVALARMVTGDAAPVAKTAEFEQELRRSTEKSTHDGLRRIASLLPDIQAVPLVILVDQLEEVYALCDRDTERDIFLGSLMGAASDVDGHVSVIVTLRSDYLARTHDHPQLNALIARQGIIVPGMTDEELGEAIARPAMLAGSPLDPATVELLLDQTKGRRGALPLLEFTLARIWDEMQAGREPVETLKRMGGVGGALAGEADRIYEELGESERTWVRHVFLSLIHVDDDGTDTRRRVALDNLVAGGQGPESLRRIIGAFAGKDTRLLTLSADADGREHVEITHEALLLHWTRLGDWIRENRNDIRFQQRLDAAARHWDRQGRPDGLLWRSPDLEAIRQFHARSAHAMRPQELEFFHASEKQRHDERRPQAATSPRLQGCHGRLRTAVRHVSRVWLSGEALRRASHQQRKRRRAKPPGS